MRVESATDQDISINFDPARRELNISASPSVCCREEELIKLPIRDRTPFDLELPNLNFPFRVLVIPAELVPLHICRLVLLFVIVMSQRNGCRPQGHGSSFWLWNLLP